MHAVLYQKHLKKNPILYHRLAKSYAANNICQPHNKLIQVPCPPLPQTHTHTKKKEKRKRKESHVDAS